MYILHEKALSRLGPDRPASSDNVERQCPHFSKNNLHREITESPRSEMKDRAGPKPRGLVVRTISGSDTSRIRGNAREFSNLSARAAG